MHRRYRVEQNTIRAVYFSHWHPDGDDIRWVYWIPETVLEREEDSKADPIEGEVLFEGRVRQPVQTVAERTRGDSDYGPFDVAPACNDHSHPPDTGNYVP